MGIDVDAPIDEDEADIWKKFISKANLHLVIIVHGQIEESMVKSKDSLKKGPRIRESWNSIKKMWKASGRWLLKI